jgi:F0F1-type ATP synthase assembly protein I
MALLMEKNSFREAAPYIGLGIQLALVVVVFYYLGKFLDDTFETAPWLSLAGATIGSVGGFISFYKKVNALSEQEKKLK